MNYFTFMIIGLGFEILGALLLSMEAIGLKTFSKYYKFIYNLSKWSKKSLLRMFLVTVLLFSPLSIAVYSNSQLLIGLIFPINLIILISSIIIDHPRILEKFVVKKTKDKSIGPIGFLIMIVGFIFQLASIIWQMSLTK